MAKKSEDLQTFSGLPREPSSKFHRRRHDNLLTHSSANDASGSFSPNVSNQLMYPEKFTDCYKEEKLKVVGKEPQAQAVPRTFYIPENSVLSKIKGFLPQLSEANKCMASKLASDSSQPSILTIEPAGLDSGESDEEELVEVSEETNRSADQLPVLAPFVEMNVSLLPSEVLANFDDSEEESSSDDEGCAEKAISVLQEDTAPHMQENSIHAPEVLEIKSDKTPSTKAPGIEELSSNTSTSDVTSNYVVPKR